jgi:epsilon-lactone hydrolase
MTRFVAELATSDMARVAAEYTALSVAQSVEAERRAWTAMCDSLDAAPDATWEAVKVGGVSAVWTVLSGVTDCTVVYFHGGGFSIGSPWHNRDMMSKISRAARARVLGIDYRLAPEHPFPAALDDSFAAYRGVLESGVDPSSVVLAGDSCGGNLALATACRARDNGAPLPAALVCISPWVDLTQSGFSYETNAHLDWFSSKEGLTRAAEIYLGGGDPRDPEASPLFANLSGLPPVLIQVGVGECLVAESIALAEGLARCRGSSVLEIWPHNLHVWPTWASQLPEGLAAIERIGDFIRSTTTSGKGSGHGRGSADLTARST